MKYNGAVYGAEEVPMKFGVFIYDGVEPIDLATYGVLSMARRVVPEIGLCTIAPQAGYVSVLRRPRRRPHCGNSDDRFAFYVSASSGVPDAGLIAARR